MLLAPPYPPTPSPPHPLGRSMASRFPQAAWWARSQRVVCVVAVWVLKPGARPPTARGAWFRSHFPAGGRQWRPFIAAACDAPRRPVRECNGETGCEVLEPPPIAQGAVVQGTLHGAIIPSSSGQARRQACGYHQKPLPWAGP